MSVQLSGEGVYPIPGLGGVGGIPSHFWGVSHPRSGEYPIPGLDGGGTRNTPQPGLDGGGYMRYPQPGLDGGGYLGYPLPGLDGGGSTQGTLARSGWWGVPLGGSGW